MIRRLSVVLVCLVSMACAGDLATTTAKVTTNTSQSAATIGQSAAAQDPFTVFAPYREATLYELDHQPWTDFLRTAVYVTGRSDRVAARRSDDSRQSGTRMTTGSTSRYRFEGNRVLFHIFDEGAIDYVAVYRQALQDTIARIDYGDLSRNEQLAFWFNLHNAVLIEEIARAHPVSQPRRLRLRRNDARLFDAKLVEVSGVALSLNDIRYKIVYRYWNDADVIYGFWEGSIGGPNIQTVAYAGSAVQTQLDLNAREFVNSLRGVDRIRGKMRVSELYERARSYFFRAWPADLYNHLAKHAYGEVADIVDTRPSSVTASRYDAHTADVEGGETVQNVGNDNPAAVAAGADLGRTWTRLSSNAMRGGFSGEALRFQEKSLELKGRRTGSVFILDIQTDDPDEQSETLKIKEETKPEPNENP